MSTALGINCKKDEILLAVARDGALLPKAPEKLTAAALLEETERLQAMLEDLGRVLAQVKPDVVRILLPEQTYKDSYNRIAPRVTLETLARLAAFNAGLPTEMLKRATARARLGMPKSGSFDSHLPEALGDPVGRYWTAGRNLAAAAAMAES